MIKRLITTVRHFETETRVEETGFKKSPELHLEPQRAEKGKKIIALLCR